MSIDISSIKPNENTAGSSLHGSQSMALFVWSLSAGWIMQNGVALISFNQQALILTLFLACCTPLALGLVGSVVFVVAKKVTGKGETGLLASRFWIGMTVALLACRIVMEFTTSPVAFGTCDGLVLGMGWGFYGIITKTSRAQQRPAVALSIALGQSWATIASFLLAMYGVSIVHITAPLAFLAAFALSSVYLFRSWKVQGAEIANTSPAPVAPPRKEKGIASLLGLLVIVALGLLAFTNLEVFTYPAMLVAKGNRIGSPKLFTETGIVLQFTIILIGICTLLALYPRKAKFFNLMSVDRPASSSKTARPHVNWILAAHLMAFACSLAFIACYVLNQPGTAWLSGIGFGWLVLVQPVVILAFLKAGAGVRLDKLQAVLAIPAILTFGSYAVNYFFVQIPAILLVAPVVIVCWVMLRVFVKDAGHEIEEPVHERMVSPGIASGGPAPRTRSHARPRLRLDDRREKAILVVVMVLPLVAMIPPTTANNALDPTYDSPWERTVLAFYYGWFGLANTTHGPSHWTDANHDVNTPDPANASRPHITCSDWPMLGLYNSSSTAIVVQHQVWAEQTGIDAFICSWWGPGNSGDANLRAQLQQASARNSSLRFCIDYETMIAVGAQDAADKVTSDFNCIYDTFVNITDSRFFLADGKPVIYVYRADWLKPAEWRKIFAGLEHQFFIVADLFPPVQAEYLALFDGVHQYDTTQALSIGRDMGNLFGSMAAISHSSKKLFSACVLPGFNKTQLKMAPYFEIPRNGGQTYQSQWESAMNAQADWISIVSWSEWAEGTQIEPALEYGDLYLNLTRNLKAQWLSFHT
nr:hypothetical protein [Candidatus Sigynarchaeota archaeon]